MRVATLSVTLVVSMVLLIGLWAFVDFNKFRSLLQAAWCAPADDDEKVNHQETKTYHSRFPGRGDGGCNGSN